MVGNTQGEGPLAYTGGSERVADTSADDIDTGFNAVKLPADLLGALDLADDVAERTARRARKIDEQIGSIVVYIRDLENRAGGLRAEDGDNQAAQKEALDTAKIVLYEAIMNEGLTQVQIDYAINRLFGPRAIELAELLNSLELPALMKVDRGSDSSYEPKRIITARATIVPVSCHRAGTIQEKVEDCCELTIGEGDNVKTIRVTPDFIDSEVILDEKAMDEALQATVNDGRGLTPDIMIEYYSLLELAGQYYPVVAAKFESENNGLIDRVLRFFVDVSQDGDLIDINFSELRNIHIDSLSKLYTILQKNLPERAKQLDELISKLVASNIDNWIAVVGIDDYLMRIITAIIKSSNPDISDVDLQDQALAKYAEHNREGRDLLASK